MVTHGFRAAVGPVFFDHSHLTNTAARGTMVLLSGLTNIFDMLVSPKRSQSFTCGYACVYT